MTRGRNHFKQWTQMKKMFEVLCPHRFHSLTPPVLHAHLYLPPFAAQTLDTPLSSFRLFLSPSFIPLGSLQAPTVRRKTDTAVHFQLDLQKSCKIKGQIALWSPLTRNEPTSVPCLVSSIRIPLLALDTQYTLPFKLSFPVVVR